MNIDIQNQFLSWAVNSKYFEGIKEYSFSFNKKNYFSFVSKAKYKNLDCFGYGRSLNKKEALLKSVGEAIERYVMLKYFKEDSLFCRKAIIENGKFIIKEKQKSVLNLPKNLRTSNGWAVHTDKFLSVNNAVKEAIERHILLKTYLTFGFSGFRLINLLDSQGFQFQSLVSNLKEAGFSAGMLLTGHKLFTGASFGYLCDRANNILDSNKWEQAFFESYASILAYKKSYERDRNYLKGGDVVKRNMDYWIDSNGSDFQEEKVIKSIEGYKTLTANLFQVDLKTEFGLNFPLFASYVFGGNLVPLYFYESISEKEKEYLKEIFNTHQINKKIPKRHPVL